MTDLTPHEAAEILRLREEAQRRQAYPNLRMAWVARRECGHIVSAHADDDTPEESAESLLWVKEKSRPTWTYERMTPQQVRDEGFCTCV